MMACILIKPSGIDVTGIDRTEYICSNGQVCSVEMLKVQRIIQPETCIIRYAKVGVTIPNRKCNNLDDIDDLVSDGESSDDYEVISQ